MGPRSVFVVLRGETIIALCPEKGDADVVCAMQPAEFDSRVVEYAGEISIDTKSSILRVAMLLHTFEKRA